MTFDPKINHQAIEDLSNSGLTDEEICKELNITLDEYNNVINGDLDINDSIDYLY